MDRKTEGLHVAIGATMPMQIVKELPPDYFKPHAIALSATQLDIINRLGLKAEDYQRTLFQLQQRT